MAPQYKAGQNVASAKAIKMFYVALLLAVPLALFSSVLAIDLNLLKNGFWQNTAYVIASIAILLHAYFLREKNHLAIMALKQLAVLAALNFAIMLAVELISLLPPGFILAKHTGPGIWKALGFASVGFKKNYVVFLPLFLLAIFLSYFRTLLKKKQFDENVPTAQTSGHFGSAAFATQADLAQINAYDPGNGLFVGADEKGRALYLPLCNKLTLSPPGGGKTSASSVPALLSHPGPVFVFDVKGELWAVTARYRAESLKRQVVAIDPFNVTQSEGFRRGKPESLLKKYCLNPFDWLPEERQARDRVLNAFAASLVVNEGGHATHFDENAKILLRGYIDYLMQQEKALRTLPMLHQLLSEGTEEAQVTFAQMAQLPGRAGAAANQVGRVGADERGSILSTSYRQVDWLGGSHMQQMLSESNFNLRDFLKGNMDIFVILPEDQIKEHGRLVRMVLALLMGMLVQADPNELPKQKILFLLEELAQLAPCPDVEQCIEVLRARGVVVWSVFQALGQIELFAKPDLFKGAPLKQIFTNDDAKTMEWVQTLGGKKTVLTKTLSNNSGDSRQKTQFFGGSVSKGEGESVHEAGADLIQLNEIRELPQGEQFVFLQGARPIRCKKIRYFEHEVFAGKYDRNPLEEK